ncbi:hypothetical protein DPMN_053858 [Dreissena polymorpha]|uniref:Uncharacterized protein n=1 Tax=Dreissena polymorpha TaxID=45954 RepID=A0A9D4CNW1_DREPO|nr:hypothetical protein DPMN_053858 [Dreissena polymorpha]
MHVTVCDKYSKQWGFEYNFDECGVIALNDSVRSCRERKWYTGTQQLNKAKVYNHISLICDESLSTTK